MRALSAAIAALILVAGTGAGFAQSARKPVRPSEQAVPASEAAARERLNANTIGIATGQIEGLYPRLGAEIAKVLDGKDMRVLPILAYGAASNVEDLLFLRGIDVAFTQSDALEYFKKVKPIANIEKRIHYAARLYGTELHVLARPDIRSMEDLRGKKVNFGPVGNSAWVTGPIVFDRLGIQVERLTLDHASALQKLRSGEISALVRVIGKPLDYFSSLPADSGLHFLEVSGGNLFDDIYSLGELTNGDYPNLVKAGERIDTITVPTVLAVFSHPRNTERGQRVDRFIDALLTKFEALQNPAFHPKWRDLNLNAQVPGWTRAPAAEETLKRLMADKKQAAR